MCVGRMPPSTSGACASAAAGVAPSGSGVVEPLQRADVLVAWEPVIAVGPYIGSYALAVVRCPVVADAVLPSFLEPGAGIELEIQH